MDGRLEHFIIDMIMRNDPIELDAWREACELVYGKPQGHEVPVVWTPRRDDG